MHVMSVYNDQFEIKAEESAIVRYKYSPPSESSIKIPLIRSYLNGEKETLSFLNHTTNETPYFVRISSRHNHNTNK